MKRSTRKPVPPATVTTIAPNVGSVQMIAYASDLNQIRDIRNTATQHFISGRRCVLLPMPTVWKLPFREWDDLLEDSVVDALACKTCPQVHREIESYNEKFVLKGILDMMPQG